MAKSGEKWSDVVQSMYYLKDNTWTLHDIIKYHVLLQRGHTETHTDTQTNKVIAITLLCKINNYSSGEESASYPFIMYIYHYYYKRWWTCYHCSHNDIIYVDASTIQNYDQVHTLNNCVAVHIICGLLLIPNIS